jgi:hypothetical protein
MSFLQQNNKWQMLTINLYQYLILNIKLKLARAGIFVFSLLLASACSEPNDTEPSVNFLKIYDDSRFNASYIPIDIIQTEDEGFLILSGTRLASSDFIGVYIMKVDREGNFVNDIILPETVVHPVADWLFIGGTYYFFAMNATSLGTLLYSVSEGGNLTDPTEVNLTYPLHASTDENSFILLSYDNNSKSTVLSTISLDGSIQNSRGFTIGPGDDIEEPIIDHFTRTGRQFPFLTGRSSSGLYYFNGFYNYTFSLVFTDLNSDEPAGVVQGQREEGGFSTLLPLRSDIYAAARFNFGDNYTLPNTNISSTGISSIIDLGGNPALEWVSGAHVAVEQIIIGNIDVIIFASTTKSSQIMLSIFSANDGTWLGTEYLGFSTPYQLINLAKTTENEIVVLGSTAVAGRFNRICMFKLSEENLVRIMGN